MLLTKDNVVLDFSINAIHFEPNAKGDRSGK